MTTGSGSNDLRISEDAQRQRLAAVGTFIDTFSQEPVLTLQNYRDGVGYASHPGKVLSGRNVTSMDMADAVRKHYQELAGSTCTGLDSLRLRMSGTRNDMLLAFADLDTAHDGSTQCADSW